MKAFFYVESQRTSDYRFSIKQIKFSICFTHVYRFVSVVMGAIRVPIHKILSGVAMTGRNFAGDGGKCMWKEKTCGKMGNHKIM